MVFAMIHLKHVLLSKLKVNRVLKIINAALTICTLILLHAKAEFVLKPSLLSPIQTTVARLPLIASSTTKVSAAPAVSALLTLSTPLALNKALVALPLSVTQPSITAKLSTPPEPLAKQPPITTCQLFADKTCSAEALTNVSAFTLKI